MNFGQTYYCKNCGKKYSSAAKWCPQCEHGRPITKVLISKCRTCGKELVRRDFCFRTSSGGSVPHISVEVSSHGDVRASTGYSSSRSRVYDCPCPNCGDVKPLMRVRDTLWFTCIFWLLTPWWSFFLVVLSALPPELLRRLVLNIDSGHLASKKYYFIYYIITFIIWLWLMRKVVGWKLLSNFAEYRSGGSPYGGKSRF